jgi:hypothetical protein
MRQVPIYGSAYYLLDLTNPRMLQPINSKIFAHSFDTTMAALSSPEFTGGLIVFS